MTFKLPFCSNVLIVVHGFHLSGKYWGAKFSKELGSHCCFNGLYFSSWSSQLHPLTWKNPETNGKHEWEASDVWHCGLMSIMGFMKKRWRFEEKPKEAHLQRRSVTWMWPQKHEALAWSSQIGDGHIHIACLPTLQRHWTKPGKACLHGTSNLSPLLLHLKDVIWWLPDFTVQFSDSLNAF